MTYEFKNDHSGWVFTFDLCKLNCIQEIPDCNDALLKYHLSQSYNYEDCIERCENTYDIITDELRYLACMDSCKLPDIGSNLVPFDILINTTIYFAGQGQDPFTEGFSWPNYYTTLFDKINSGLQEHFVEIPHNLNIEFPTWYEGSYCFVHRILLTYDLGDHLDFCEYTFYECYDTGK